MLIDATHDEETRVAVVDDRDGRLLEFDYESQFRKPLKGNIFLAKVTRVEPSLQAAFVNFGGNRHGFLPFSEIHPDYFRIPIADREALIAEQEALLAEEEEEEEEKDNKELAENGDSESNNSSDNEGSVEVKDNGGEDNIVTLNSDEDGDSGSDNDEDKNSSSDADASDKNDADHAEDNESDSDEDDDDDGDDEDDSNNQSSNNKGRRRNNNNNRRGRRGGRGRGGNRHRRAAHDSRKVEIIGGTEYEDSDSSASDRFRFALRRKYKIQEVIKRGQIMLIQVSREERGNKGAAVSTYLSLPGRYGVLMPNSPRAGGVSRKISNYKDRQRMRDTLRSMDIPKGMSVILRTAGVTRTKTEIKRDVDYLLKLWNDIRELTLQSSAPAMIYEEADLIKKAIRDLYVRDIEEVVAAGEEGYKNAKKIMKMLIPSHAKKVKLYKDDIPLFHKYKVESQISDMNQPTARLKSGGYLVINPTEALVSIDVNSGRATKERHIEETALNTNLEAAEEVARQMRLRDLGGLVVIDFIDMEDRRNNARVERKLKEALSNDRARIQMGRISSFGLLELSRQRLNPSLLEAQYDVCPSCNGRGVVRNNDSTSIMLLRALEEEAIKGKAGEITAYMANDVALYILNHKRKHLETIESRYNIHIMTRTDETLGIDGYRIEATKPASESPSNSDDHDEDSDQDDDNASSDSQGSSKNSRNKRGKRGGRGRNNRQDHNDTQNQESDTGDDTDPKNSGPKSDNNTDADEQSSGQNDQDGPKPNKGRGRKKSSNAKSKSVEITDDNQDDSDNPDQNQETKKPAAKESSKSASKDSGEAKPARGRGRKKKTGEDNAQSNENQDPKAEDADQPTKSSSKKGTKAPAKRRTKKADADANEAKGDDKEKTSKPAAAKPATPSNDSDPAAADHNHAEDYETVNEPPEKKKKGWWNKLLD